jgi:hypothetical protein
MVEGVLSVLTAALAERSADEGSADAGGAIQTSQLNRRAGRAVGQRERRAARRAQPIAGSAGSAQGPAFSGGGCLSALDLARFGLLFARRFAGVEGASCGSGRFLESCRNAKGPALSRSRPWQRYSGHLMTDGLRVGHAGYGGQYLMIDPDSGRVALYLGVLENESGYDEAFMARIARSLEALMADQN